MPLAVRGFGDPWNSYLQSMTWFEGKLYCGTARAANCFLYARKVGRPQWHPWPTKCPDGDIGQAIDLRGQIWRFDPVTARWDMVYVSPLVKTADGREFPRDISYRSMGVLQTKSDAKPTLYVNNFTSWRSGKSATILRSEDGTSFEDLSRDGFGLQSVSSYRTLRSFKGRLYTTAVGHGSGVINTSRYPVVFECDDLASQQWRPVSEPGFGDPDNVVVFELEVFDGHLYAGTGNYVSGLQLWKTNAEGPRPYEWKRILHGGAYRGVFNEGVAAMCVFKDGLYISGCIQDGGYDRVNRIGPGAPELIRVNPDDSWDLIVGSPRLTPEGVREPTSGYHPGFDDITNGYFWRMCVHQDRLYVGTLNWAVYLPYVDRKRLPDPARHVLEGFGVNELVEQHGGFDLWSTADGDHFSPVTLRGFANPFNCGARTLVSSPIGLVVGTVNPFGPEVAEEHDGVFRYVPNRRGGAEVWLGASTLPANLLDAVPHGALQGDRGAENTWRLPSVDQDVKKRIRLVADEERDPGRFEFDAASLRRRASAIDQAALIADPISEARGLFDLQATGLEHLPQAGPVLLLGNNPVAPLLIDFLPVAAHTVYTLDAVLRHRAGPAWVLASPNYFELAERLNFLLPLLERLGYLPATAGNGIRVLERGEAVLGYPEDKPSRPPYDLRPFSTAYAQMALETGAPIVPTVFIGTHESHLLIEHKGKQVLVNKRRRTRTTFRLTFMPAIDVREQLGRRPTSAAIESFCSALRRQMETVIELEKNQRPLVKLVEHLQRRHLRLRKDREETPISPQDIWDDM